jgi:arsenite methyltransferase
VKVHGSSDPRGEELACSDKPYESPSMREVTGPTIRPGGLFLTERALDLCAFGPGDRVLDIGCGLGATVELMKERYQLDATGIDLSETLIAQGRARNPALQLRLGDAANLPFADGQMDGVMMECVLSITGAAGRVLAEARRVLRPGGCLILTDMYLREARAERIDATATPHQPRANACSCLTGAVTRTEMEEQLEGAGFELSLWEDHTVLLKRLAAEIILKYGSLSEFWSEVYGKSEYGEEAGVNARHGRLGYCLVIATHD